MVTIDSLRARGYEISSLKSTNTITLAESDIKFAYFPSDETFEDETVVDLLHALVFSLLLRRKIVSTRYGSVTKVSQYTIQADSEAITSEIRSYCLMRLEKYIATNDFAFTDILKLYDSVIFI